MTPTRIGLYGGTFDPIHFGHLNMAIALAEAHDLDTVLLCPARISPFKEQEVPTAISHRISMIDALVEEIPGFQLLDWEAKQKGPSYTVNTLEALTQGLAFPNAGDAKYFLLVGDDTLAGFFRWQRPDDIIEMVSLLVGRRHDTCDFTELKGHQQLWSAASKGLTATPIMEISATDIRSRLRQNQYCGHLVPGKVLDYIAQHRLYR